MSSTVAIVGSGSLAGGLCASLAQEAAAAGFRIAVVARSARLAEQLAYLARARAAVRGAAVDVTAHPLDLRDPARLARKVAELDPAVLVNCASIQSPWESKRAPSAWTDVLARGGFGLGLPLHAVLARAVAQAVADAGTATLFVNASYPDAVNPLLHGVGLPVHCGIGNIGTIAASLRAGLEVKPGQELRMLAHHLHLHAPSAPAGELVARLDGEPVPEVGDLLAAQRRCEREALNAVTSHSGAAVVMALLDGRPHVEHVPGPHGLPGGYSVRIEGPRLTVELPPGISGEQAAELQEQWGLEDGVSFVRTGGVRFGAAAMAVLERHVGGVCEHCEPQEVIDLAERLTAVRDRLRRLPRGSAEA